MSNTEPVHRGQKIRYQTAKFRLTRFNASNPYIGEGGLWFLSNLRQRACAVADGAVVSITRWVFSPKRALVSFPENKETKALTWLKLTLVSIKSALVSFWNKKETSALLDVRRYTNSRLHPPKSAFVSFRLKKETTPLLRRIYIAITYFNTTLCRHLALDEQDYLPKGETFCGNLFNNWAFQESMLRIPTRLVQQF